ncbi:MAG: mechanosensitive ion channel family protein [Verrucomicrobia bacterium]|nr:mechanosensitive ion channel family protein [Verrucomicrobiota bacterium]
MIRRLQPRLLLQLGMFLCSATLVWSLWSLSLAAETTNTTTVAKGTDMASKASALTRKVINEEFIQSHKTELSFWINQLPGMEELFLGIPRWQYAASLLYLILAVSVSRALDWLIQNRLKHWASKTDTEWDDILVKLADGPVKAITLVFLIHIGLELYNWPLWLEINISRLSLIVGAVALTFIALRVIDLAIAAWRRQPKQGGDVAFNDQFVLLIGKLLKAVLILITSLTLLGNLGVDITAILGSVSVLGLAFGLAAQDSVANLFGAVAVFVDKPFKVGDRIKVGSDVDGVVEAMGLRSTKVRNADGFLITLPNKSVGNNTVINVSARPSIRTVLNYGLTYDTPAHRIDFAANLLRSIFTAHSLTGECQVTFNRFDASALNIEVNHQCLTRDLPTYQATLHGLNLEVKERFDAEKLEFAFPTQTVFIKKDTSVAATPSA